MKKSISIFTALLLYTFASAQIVNIPDANFKASLISDPAINTNGDGEIQVSEAGSFIGSLSCTQKNIKDLTGIEAFINIKELDCSRNQLASLDTSKNTALKTLLCGINQLKSLDVSKNTSLSVLTCYTNQLTNLDLSKNIELKYIECYDNQLTSLDLSKNILLETLFCDQNELTSLDVSKCPVLGGLTCYENQLTNLDLTQNIKLGSLDCAQNNLMTLDLSKNKNLIYLDCSNNQLSNLNLSMNENLDQINCRKNQLTNLDVSKQKLLNFLYCSENKLVSLNIKNGNNTNIADIDLVDNPFLTCIQVDNAAYSTTNWTRKDSWASYNTDCNYLSNGDVQKSALKIYPNPVKNILNIQTSDKLHKVEIYSANGQLVKTSFLKETNVEALPKGNYVVKILTEKGVRTEKIIKE